MRGWFGKSVGIDISTSTHGETLRGNKDLCHMGMYYVIFCTFLYVYNFF